MHTRSVSTRLFFALAIGLAFLPKVFGQVIELSPVTSPSAVQANLTDATITALRGIPAGTTAAQLVARITPQNPLDGAAIDAPVTLLQTIGSRTNLRFRVPAGFLVQRPVAAYVEIVNASGAPPISTGLRARTVILPPPSIESVWQPSAVRGTTIDVTINGLYTAFPANPASMTLNFGAGITATPKLCASGASTTQVCATVVVSAGSATGPRNVSVTYGAVTATLANGFVVTSAASNPLTVNGGTIRQGETRDITFGFGIGTTLPQTLAMNFGSQVFGPANGQPVSITQGTATTAATAVIRVTASDLAAVGPRNIMFLAGGDVYTLNSGLTVTSSDASISLNTNTFTQGESRTVQIVGRNTHFVQNLTAVSFGAGITVGSVDVQDQTLSVQIAVSPTAAAGPRSVSVTTQGEAPLPVSAVVVAGSPRICNVTPSYATQGTSGTLTLQFCFINPAASATVTIPGNVTTGARTVSGANLSVPFSVASTAPTGGRTGVVSFGGVNYDFPFTVIPSTAALVSACREPGCESPVTSFLGDSFTLRVTGSNTNFVQGTTQVSLTLPPVASLAVRRVTVIRATELLVDVQTLSSAVPGLYRLDVVTGGESVSLANVVRVSPTPQLTITPSSGLQGTSVPVTFNIDNGGILPTSCPAIQVPISGVPPGVTCQGYVRSNPSQATATFVIDQYAAVGPRILQAGGSQATFSVVASPASLISVVPNTAPAGTSATLVLTGSQTHWCQGSVSVCPYPTALTFFSSSIVVDSLTVNSPTQATANVRILSTAVPGLYSVQMATGGEVVSLFNGFRVTGQVVVPPSLTSASPSTGVQGQTLDVVLSFANLVTPITAATPVSANFGPGITTVSTAFVSANSFRATLTVSPLAAIGPRTVSTTVNGAAISGSAFIVNRGPAAIQTLNPSSARQGQSNVTVQITGNSGTHFATGQTTADFGPGITVNSLVIQSPTSATAQITLAYSATLGARTVRLTTGGELADSVGVFTVMERNPVVLSVSPARARQGETVVVTVLGEATSFGSTTVPDFGPGITATLLTTPALERATVRLVISPTIAIDQGICARSIRMTTGAEIASSPSSAFCIDAGSAAISSVAPASVPQGGSETVTVNGTNTNFQQGVTTVNFGSGITVGTVLVQSPVALTAQIAVAPNAAPGLRSVRATTLGEAASGNNLFTVGAGTPILTQASPATLPQGAGPTVVTLTGQFTTWQQGVTTATFGAGVTVDSLTVDSPTSARATVRVSPTTNIGPRIVTATTGGQIVSAPVFSIVTGPAAISTLSRVSALQGETNVEIEVTGVNTHFQPLVTSVGLRQVVSPLASLAPSSVVITSETSLRATFSIPANQAVGAYTITATTAGEVAERSAAFSVNPGVPSISSLSPSASAAGTQLAVTISGTFTVWQQGVTAVSFGAGITVDNVAVQGPSSIIANITIAANATVGPRTVSVTTGGQVLTSSFSVTPAAILLSLNPTAMLRGQTRSITITGQQTQFAQGVTTVAFSGTGVTVNSVTVSSATQLVANVTVAQGAAVGPRTITVTTGSEVLTGLSLPIATGMNSISPVSGSRGQTLEVTINGASITSFVQGQSLPAFGPGITVNSVQVLSASQLTANITIAANAELTARDVVVTTGQELVSGPSAIGGITTFTVTGAPMFSLDPTSAQQGQQGLTVNINAQNLPLAAGDTFISFGAGITAGEVPVNVTSPQTGSVTINVSPTAVTGLRQVTLRTGGVFYTVNNFNVTPSAARLLTVTPASANQGDVVDVTVVGQNTNFAPTTVFAFGQGIAATLLGVDSVTQVRLRLTIDPSAPVGPRSPVFTTGGENASGTGLFTVTAGTPTLLSVTPVSAQQGETVAVTILGRFTNFDSASAPNFGPGVTVNQFVVNSPTSITANVTVLPRAFPGTRSVAVSGVSTSLPNAFTIVAGPAAVSSLNPNTLQQNRTASITINGVNTHFADGLTVANFGPGVTVNSLTVTSPILATASITVSPTAAVGFRSITMTTEGETASILNGFNVLLGAGVIDSVTPNTAPQGATTSVTVTGFFPGLVGQTVTASFSGPSDITASVSSVTLTQITLSVQVLGYAARTPRNLALTNGTDPVSRANAITIVAGAASITAIAPTAGKQDETVDITVTGSGTSFGQAPSATTAMLIGASGVNIVSVTPQTPQQAVVRLQISDTASIGTFPLRLFSGDEIATFTPGFTIQPGAPVILSATPASGRQGETVSNYVIAGKFTHFTTGSAINLGTGITATVQSASPTQLIAQLSIAANATAGVRDLTVTTGAEVVTLPGAFTVQPGTAVLTTVSTNIAPRQGRTVVFTVNANFTSFSSATPPTVNLGTGVTTQSVAVDSATRLSVTGLISPTTTLGPRSVTVNPGALTLSAAYEVTAGDASITVAPTTVRQGDSNFEIQIAGVSTNFSQSTTALSLSGAGLNLGNYTVNSATSITLAVNSVSDTAPLGSRTLTITTGGEVVSATLDVLAGLPVISSIAPTSGTQASAVPVTITGRFTTFTAGSTIGLGAGITAVINSASPTVLQATLTISPTAAKTTRPLTVDGLTLANAFTVTPSPARITSVTPALGAQGAALAVQVDAADTNFANGITTATFGAGITVNSVTVVNVTRANVNITIAGNAATGVRTPILTTGGEEASLVNAFVVSVGQPEITSITPSIGAANSTVSNIQVTGVNLTGATFSLGGSFVIPPAALGTALQVGGEVLEVTNLTATSATLRIRFGPFVGIHPLIATTAAASSATEVTPGNRFQIFEPAGYQIASPTTVVNSSYTSLDPVSSLTYAVAAPVNVVNSSYTSLDPVSSLTYAVSAPVNVVNSSFTSLDPVSSLTYAFAPPVNVVNSSYTSLDPVTSLNYAASHAVHVRNLSAPVITAAPDTHPEDTATSAARNSGAPLRETAYAGQMLRVRADIPNGVRINEVLVYVNGAKMDDVLLPPYEAAITVPSGVDELEIRSVVRTEAGEISSDPYWVRVLPDPGTSDLQIQVRDGDDKPVADADPSLRLAGFAAEHFRFDQPITAMPDLAADRKPDATGFAAMLYFLPLGQDPLGTGAVRDTVSRYRASLKVWEPGEYEFALRGSTGAQLRVGGREIENGAGPVSLPAGEVELEVLHFRSVDASPQLQLLWRTKPSEPFTAIRPEYLRTPAVDTRIVPLAASGLELRAATQSPWSGETLVSAEDRKQIIILRVSARGQKQEKE
ncbi:hypothetical protein F183_A21650 [Bryobacterales bacterium F-183]|nr:hypothetical protein F183_A21650 [Bryobacterales bacterium F-183]